MHLVLINNNKRTQNIFVADLESCDLQEICFAQAVSGCLLVEVVPLKSLSVLPHQKELKTVNRFITITKMDGVNPINLHTHDLAAQIRKGSGFNELV